MLSSRLVLLFLLLALPLGAAETPDFASLEEAVRQDLAATRVPGVAVAVVSGDRVVFAKGFGVANVETGAPVTTATLFQIGSVTKLLTATTVVGLAEEGKVRLDAPIGTYVQGLAPRIAEVTLHHLLSQTAGLSDHPGEYGPHDETALAEAARGWKDDLRPIAPGLAFSYSNPGFALAGLVAQEVQGKPFADLVAERLFTPLGMTRTTFRPTMAMTWPLAAGHELEGKEKPEVVRPFADDARFWPAGSTVYTSADDLARFARAFVNGGRLEGRQVLPPPVVKSVSTPRIEIPTLFTEGRYGYGLFLMKDQGLQVLEHAGTMTGFSALIRLQPEHRFALIVLANGSASRFPRTVETAMRLLLPVKPDAPAAPLPEVAMSQEEMARLAGTYVSRWPMEVVHRDGQLFLRRFGQELPLRRTGDRRFAVQPSGADRPQELVAGPAGPDGHPLFLQMALWVFPRTGTP